MLRTGAGLLVEEYDSTTSFYANYRPQVGFYYDREQPAAAQPAAAGH